MSQIEVFDFLKRQRQTGSYKYFSVKEIEKGLKDNGGKGLNSVARCTQRLYASGLLLIDCKMKIKGKPWYGWNRKFKAKGRY